ncbi:MAG: Spore photoproduct lyase [Candidatus Omnitrophica bacterium ADurb.Bin277]|nr:MAG: Spore photoproduct lyase [Candidatus Omnitrophica bacterium ADurb.Bin277]
MKPALDHIFIDPHVKGTSLVRRILQKNPRVPATIITDKEKFLKEAREIPLGQGKRNLWLTEFKGPLLKPCPATGEDYLCCRYQTINTQTNCPLDCSYCILQHFLNFPMLTVYVNANNVLKEIDALIASEPKRLFRMGTGELTDSLALDPLTRINETLIRHALKRKYILEIKTKTNLVTHLPEISRRNILVSWSLNPDQTIREEEHKAAPLEARLRAAKTALKKGYRLGFHFDPLLLFKGWEKAYGGLIHKLTKEIPEKEVMWISLGSLRYPSELKRILDERFPRSKIGAAEFLKGLDGKMRYFRPERTKLYAKIYGMLRKHWKDVFIYFCMENRTIWNDIMGFSPRDNAELDRLFQESIEKRFPEINKP